MNVSLEKLRTALEHVLEHVEAEYGVKVEVDVDYYWVISKEQRYDVYKQPREFTIGSLADDYAEVVKLCDTQRDILTSDLAYIGRLLIALGEEKLL